MLCTGRKFAQNEFLVTALNSYLCILYMASVPAVQRAQRMSGVKTNRLVVSGEIIAFYCETHVYINSSVWQNADILNVTTGVTYCYHWALNVKVLWTSLKGSIPRVGPVWVLQQFVTVLCLKMLPYRPRLACFKNCMFCYLL